MLTDMSFLMSLVFFRYVLAQGRSLSLVPGSTTWEVAGWVAGYSCWVDDLLKDTFEVSFLQRTGLGTSGLALNLH